MLLSNQESSTDWSFTMLTAGVQFKYILANLQISSGEKVQALAAT